MSINITRGTSDEIMDQIIDSLKPYETDHPKARIDVYRLDSVSVRLRIIDPDFAGKDRVERSTPVWKYFENLSEETQSDISMVVLVTPEEMPKSIANLEFEDPVPSIF